MANFEIAFGVTMEHEGGYVNDPSDAGGETYKGISRRYNPSWSGWKMVDDWKSKPDFPACLDYMASLPDVVKAFYKQHYWDKFWGDEIPDQALATELFDTGVNMGIGRAVKFLQKGLNLLNRNEKTYKDIVVDGGFGAGTLFALKSYLEANQVSYLLKIMNILQGAHYIDYMTKSPAQEKYARGWLKRVEFKKS